MGSTVPHIVSIWPIIKGKIGEYSYYKNKPGIDYRVRRIRVHFTRM